ncbi:hypothetical protein BJX99DRAFT_21844 [Aspergillus californicus]
MTELSPLSALPTELLVEIFQACPSFQAATSLAATSKQFRKILKQFLTPIYVKISSRTIRCHTSIRELLAALEILPEDKQILTLDDVKHIVQAAAVGDEILTGYKVMTADEYSRFDPQVSRELSPAEEIRLLRGHYQLLRLMCGSDTEQSEQIAKLDLKTLFLLADFTCVFMAEEVDASFIGNIVEDSYRAAQTLQDLTRAERNKVFAGLYKQPYYPRHYTPRMKGGRYAWWCDCQQEVFKQMITGRVFCEDESNRTDVNVRDDLWYDSSDERD